MSRSASVPSWPASRTASIRWGSARRAETSAVATRSSYSSRATGARCVGTEARGRIFMGSAPSRGDEARPRLDVPRVEAACSGLGLGDDAVLDQLGERLFEGHHAVAHARDQAVAQLMGLALLD